MKNCRIILLLFLSLCMGYACAQPSVPPFKKGERVVFVGNSITHGGHYHSFIWLYYMTRFPNSPVTLMNAGIGGECAWDIKDRMQYDVFDRKPTYVVLTFGMNDTGYDVFMKDNREELAAQRVEKSLDSYRDIERLLLDKKHVTKTLIGGSPYDETTKFNGFILHGKNDAIRKIISAQRRSAEKNGWGFVDFNEPMRRISLAEQKKDSTFTFCRVDRIHPDNDGQMVMAYLFLKAQGLAGRKVADVSVDASDKRVLTQENCKISKLQLSDDGLSFDYLANSLPYPLDSVSRSGWGNKRSQLDAMKLVPFMEEFNQERLAVSHLQEGRYSLSIDSIEIGEFTSAELSEGINLAEYPSTPQYQQAMKILYLNEERFEVEKRFREYMWVECTYLKKYGLLFADNEEAIKKLHEDLPKDGILRMSYHWYIQAMHPEIRAVWQNYMNSIVDTIYKINKPAVHKITVKKVS